MITQKDLGLLTDYVAQKGIAVSLYLNLDEVGHNKEKRDIMVKDLIKEAQKKLDKTNLDREGLNSIEKSLLRVRNIVSTEQTVSRCKSLAMFINQAENLCYIYRLPVPTKSRLTFDKTFYLRPLLSMLQQYNRIGVVLTDSKHARFFEIYLGEIIEYFNFSTDGEKPKKPLLETFMKRDKHLMQKKSEETHRHLSSVADVLKSHFAIRRFDKLIIGAHKPIGEQLTKLLHHKLQENLIGVFEIDIHAKENEVLTMALDIQRGYEFQEEYRLLRKIADTIESAGPAVKGIRSVIVELNARNIRTLAVANDYAAEGTKCSQCRLLYLDARECVVCGKRTDIVPDIVGNVVEEAIRQGASIRHIWHADLISSLENIAAEIKFKRGGFVKTIETIGVSAAIF
jgi:peptide subunit release factor 1 (eRF1)